MPLMKMAQRPNRSIIEQTEMAKLEVTKTIEARMLNKRNRQVLSQPPVTLPYGAILTDIVENRDVLEFHYLGELYNCKRRCSAAPRDLWTIRVLLKAPAHPLLQPRNQRFPSSGRD